MERNYTSKVKYTDIAKFAGHLPNRYGNSRAIWDHTVLPATRQRWHSRLYPSEAGTRLSDPGGMQGWVDLVDEVSPYVLQVIEIVRKNVRVLCESLLACRGRHQSLLQDCSSGNSPAQSVDNQKLYRMLQRVFSRMLWNGGRGLLDCLAVDQRYWDQPPNLHIDRLIDRQFYLYGAYKFNRVTKN